MMFLEYSGRGHMAEAVKMLHKNGENNYKTLSMVTIDNNGKLYIQPKYGKFKTGQYALARGVDW